MPYYAFYGSLYDNALVRPIDQEQPPERRRYASQAYFNVILRYIPRNRIHCVGTFHLGFTRETKFDWIVKIDPFAPLKIHPVIKKLLMILFSVVPYKESYCCNFRVIKMSKKPSLNK